MANWLQEVLLGTPGGYQSNLNQQQQGVQGDLLSQIMNILQGKGGNNPIEQNARQQFQSQTIPSLLERFTAGSGNSSNSSALQGALGSAASGLESQLASQQYGQLGNLLGHGLQSSQDYMQRSPGLLEAFSGPAGQALLGYLSGGGGSQITSALGGLFNKGGQGGGMGGLGQGGGFENYTRPKSVFNQQPNNYGTGGKFGPLFASY